MLTAGEWNDLNNWGFWADIIDDDNYSGKTDYWEFYPENLVVVKVVDNNNVGIANVSVELFNNKSREFVAKRIMPDMLTVGLICLVIVTEKSRQKITR